MYITIISNVQCLSRPMKMQLHFAFSQSCVKINLNSEFIYCEMVLLIAN